MQAAQNADAGDRARPGPQDPGQNVLGAEPSAYLRQHAGNPVHWQPFSDAAFAAAASRDVPVFLSIGYAACHWCHVMAHESFEDPATADYLNAHFVAIKVDREERPDVDAVYMAATQAISGEGGWPMSVFLTPDGRAFHAGTYFPPRPTPGRPSFRQVLEAVQDAWRDRRDAVEATAQVLAQGLGDSQLAAAVTVAGPAPLLDPELLPDAVASLARSEDLTDGGFGAAPKFPPSAVLEFLIRHAAVPSETAGAARGMAGRTLAAMARSALFDQLDGGFARYSVTRDWSVPHFEKMLYDNAQLLRAYVHWVRLGGSDVYSAAEAAEVAARTADWMLDSLGLDLGLDARTMPAGSDAGGNYSGGQAHPEALASSLDADSLADGEHHEGASYLWTRGGLQEVLGAEDGAAVATLMNVGEEGTVSVYGSPLHPASPLLGAAADLWTRARPALLAARRLRPQPARDGKIVAGWNGLAVAALAEAGAVLGRADLVAASESIAAYLERVHWKPAGLSEVRPSADGSVDSAPALVRVSHAGTARGIGGLLEDYAFCAEGLFALYAVTGRPRWYRLAEKLVLAACHRFVVDGRLVDTAGGSGQVLAAQGGQSGLDPFDNATPSGAAAFAGTLLSYAALSGSAEHRRLAEHVLSLLPPLATRAPRVAGWLLATAQAALAGPVEAAVVGSDSPERTALHRELVNSASPGLVIAVENGGAEAGSAEYGGAEADGGADVPPSDAASRGGHVPLLAGRPRGPGGAPLVYLCRNMVCERPVGTLEALRTQLREFGSVS
jgi:uncharacterized protein YyaL (SSP411 family)